METNPIPRSRKCFRCICLNSVGTALSVGRIFSIYSPPHFLAEHIGNRYHAYPTILQFLIKASILFGSQPPAPFAFPLAGVWPDPKPSTDEEKHSIDEEKHSIQEGKHSTDEVQDSTDELSNIKSECGAVVE
jgi:hypothetical protein